MPQIPLLTRRAKILTTVVGAVFLLVALGFYLAYKPKPAHITYGMSFNALYARELGLEPHQVLESMLTELNIKHLRLAAHWTTVEQSKDIFSWSETDDELALATKHQADVIMAVGRRLPRWPECHVPPWAKQLSWEDQKKEIRSLITETVNRYKDNPSIVYWQVENEPFLTVFAKEHCGDFDEDFLYEEVALVRSLDASRPILVTDSGNLGTWYGAYRSGDAFGTSVYVYFWNPELGQFKTVLPPWFYRFKEGVMSLVLGHKKTFLIELSAEPWLLEPVAQVPLEIQYSRMNEGKFKEIVEYARDTRYDTQYLWGAEWWYWLKEKHNDSMWEAGKRLFSQGTL